MMNRLALIIPAVFLMNFSLAAQQPIDEKVTELLSKMTLEEKIGQMNQYNGLPSQEHFTYILEGILL